jgi:hypothetical protein
MAKAVFNSSDLYAAIWVVTKTLPSLIMLGEPYTREGPKLEAAYRRYRKWGNPPSNFDGAKSLTSNASESDHSYDAFLKENHPESYEQRMEARARADAYVHLVEEVSKRWRFGDNYGPHVIHSVIHSRTSFGPGRLQGSAFLTKPRRFTLRFDVDPYARRSEEAVEEIFPNALRPLHPRIPLPEATWIELEPTNKPEEFELHIKVRDLKELEEFMPSVLRVFSQRSRLPIKRSRRDAYAKLGRDTRWFYLHHCEGKTLDQIAEEEAEDERDIDPSVVHKAIAKVRWLLTNPEMRLS